MRRSRERQRRTLRCYTIEVRDKEIATLVRDGFLQAELRGERVAVINALHAFLDRHLV
jgi:hypothetical protein